MNPPINELRPGDWILFNKWYKVTSWKFGGLGIQLNERGHVAEMHPYLKDLITATHRGDTPPPTDREMLEYISREDILLEQWEGAQGQTVWMVYRWTEKYGKKELTSFEHTSTRTAVRAAMKEEQK